MDGVVTLQVIIDRERETMWTTQKTIANLFKVSVKNVSKHLNNISESGKLNKDDVSFNPNNSTNSGIPLINPQSTKQPILYNLDTIISIEYRVRDSKEATRFKIWTTDLLKKNVKNTDLFKINLINQISISFYKNQRSY